MALGFACRQRQRVGLPFMPLIDCLNLPAAPLALAEPYATAVFMTVIGVLVAVSVLFSKAVDRIGVPVVLLFLVLGMLGGSEGIGGIEFSDYGIAVRLGTMALVLILFDGGLNTRAASIRQVLGPASVLATAGVLLTAALVTLFARLLGMPWPAALLLGAVVSSTDAAAVFAVLRGGRLQLRPRLGRTLEVESCINDPMAVILTTTLIQWLTQDGPVGLRPLLAVPVQLLVGAGVGLILGYLGVMLLRRVRLTTVGLYPVLTLAMAFVSFGLATVVNGSGFLSVYVTAVVLGNKAIPFRAGLSRIHDALAWMSQIGMFLMLGLLVYPSKLLPVLWMGLAVGLFLGIVARPLAVLPCLWPFGFGLRDMLYIGWTGLRGAVPIILATFPVLAGVEGAEQVFNVVFFIVVVSSFVPGATIRTVTRRLGLTVPDHPVPAAVLEINSTMPLGGELASFYIDESLAVCDAALADITFPDAASIVLIVRDGQLMAPKGNTTLRKGDHAYVFFRQPDRPFIELLFGGPEE
ncbi:MAG TPA: potassium/proton antiporter [Tepidisphaeraceae bacterium]|jgi:cell volume regulation protein A|nr:potassium/proton antiporter [Tepidisphaeraceae bacterium]